MNLRGGGPNKIKIKETSPLSQTKIWKYLNKKIKADKAENRDKEQAKKIVLPDSQGSPKNRVDRPEEIDSGIKLYKQTWGSPTGPPLGKRNRSPIKLPSSIGENPCQEGGTGKEQEAPKSKKPPLRESARGSQVEGRE